jgi:hypothetical protein
MKTLFGLLVLGILLAGTPAYSGLVITQTTSSGEENPPETETVYIQDNRIKIVGEQTMIFNVSEGTFTMLSPEHKAYTTGSPAEMMAGRQAAAKQMQQQMLQQMPPEQRKAYEEAMKSMGMEGMPGAQSQTAPQKIEIKKTSDTEKIAGYSCRKYEVWVNGERSADVWVAPDVSAADEIDFSAFQKMMSEIGQEGSSYENSAEYIDLMKQGYPLKSVDYGSGGSTVTQVTGVEKKKIADSEFRPPEGYEKVDMGRFGQMMH